MKKNWQNHFSFIKRFFKYLKSKYVICTACAFVLFFGLFFSLAPNVLSGYNQLANTEAQNVLSSLGKQGESTPDESTDSNSQVASSDCNSESAASESSDDSASDMASGTIASMNDASYNNDNNQNLSADSDTLDNDDEILYDDEEALKAYEEEQDNESEDELYLNGQTVSVPVDDFYNSDSLLSYEEQKQNYENEYNTLCAELDKKNVYTEQQIENQINSNSVINGADDEDDEGFASVKLTKKDGFVEERNINNEKDFWNICYDENYKKIEATLLRDVSFKDTVIVHKDCEFIFNLEGHSFSNIWNGTWHSWAYLFTFDKNVNATINGGKNTKLSHTVNVFSDADGGSRQETFNGGCLVGGWCDRTTGGINCNNGYVNLTLNDVTLAGCGTKAKETGGAIMAGNPGKGGNGTDYINIKLNNSVITGSYSADVGGAIDFAHSFNQLTMSKSRIENNYANTNAGAVMIHQQGNIIYGDSDAFNDNWKEDNTSSLAGNSVKCGRGGAIFNHSSSNSISGVVFWQNSSLNAWGGAIYNDNKETGLSVSNCRFEENSARHSGAAIHLQKNGESHRTITITDCLIQKNTCGDNQSGAVDGYSGGDYTLSGKVVIADNKNTAGQNCDVYFVTKATFHTTKHLTNESWIGVRVESNNPKDLSGPSLSTAEYFFSDESGCRVYYDNRKLKYGRGDEQKTPPSERKVAQVNPSQTIVDKYNNKDLIKTTISWTPHGVGDTVDYVTDAYYSDGYFLEDPKQYNEHLATLSVLVACSAFATNAGNVGSEMGFENDTNYLNKFAHLTQFFADMGCSPDSISVNKGWTEKPWFDNKEGGTDSSIGCAVASKTITGNNGEEDDEMTLIPISIRGGGYGAEWASNATFNNEKSGAVEGEEHEGFKLAAEDVVEFVNNYITSNNLTTKAENGKLIFWLTGYSRAGATANLAAKRLTEQYAKMNNKIFAYTTEAPRGGVAAKIVNEDYTDHGEYHNIHNIINSADIVPYVAPKKMGFIRYGVAHYLPGGEAQQTLYKTDTYDEPQDNQDWVPEYRGMDPVDNKYQKQKITMLEIMHGVNSSALWEDHFQMAEMYLVQYLTGSKPLLQTRCSLEKLQAKQFNRDFVDELVRLGKQNRTKFSSKLKIEGDFHKIQEFASCQDGLQDAMNAVFSSSDEDINNMMYGLQFIKTIVKKNINFKTWRNVINMLSYSTAEGQFKIEILNWVRKIIMTKDTNIPTFAKCLTDEQYNKVYNSLPGVLDLVLNFFSEDYHCHNTWDVGGLGHSLLRVGTLFYNLSNIFSNHMPHTPISWAMSYDSFYTKNLESLKTATMAKQDVASAKLTYVNDLGEKEVHTSGESKPIELGNNKSLTIDYNTLGQGGTSKYNGEAFYYTYTQGSKLEGLAEPDDPRKTPDAKLYSKSCSFRAKDDVEYYKVKVVGAQYGQWGEVATFTIKNHKSTYTAEVITYEDDGTQKIQQATYKCQSLHPFATTSCFNSKDFEKWVVINTNTEKEITESCIEDPTKLIADFVMPSCDCKVEALYKDVDVKVDFYVADTTMQKPIIIGKQISNEMFAYFYKDSGSGYKQIGSDPLKININWKIDGHPEQKVGEIAGSDTTYITDLSFAYDDFRRYSISFSDATTNPNHPTKLVFHNIEPTGDDKIIGKAGEKEQHDLNFHVSFSYKTGLNEYISTQNIEPIFMQNGVSKQDIISILPTTISINTILGSVPIDNISWKDFTYSKSDVEQEIKIETNDFTLPEGVALPEGKTKPDNAIVNVYVAGVVQPTPPTITVPEGNYDVYDTQTYAEHKFKTQLKYSDSEFSWLPIKYCVLYPQQKEDKTEWLDTFGNNYGETKPDQKSLNYKQYSTPDDIELTTDEGTTTNYELYCYVGGGTKERVVYSDSTIKCFGYNIMWNQRFSSKIKYSPINPSPAWEGYESEIVDSYTQNQPYDFVAQPTNKEVFGYWEQDPNDKDQIITDENKFNPMIHVESTKCTYHLTAMCAPVISKIELSLQPLVSGESYPDKVNLLKVTAHTTPVFVYEGYIQLSYIKRESPTNLTEENVNSDQPSADSYLYVDNEDVVPFNSSNISNVQVDFTQEGIKDYSAVLADNIEVIITEDTNPPDTNQDNQKSILADFTLNKNQNNATDINHDSLKYDYEYELDEYGRLSSLTIWGLMSTSRKADLKTIEDKQFRLSLDHDVTKQDILDKVKSSFDAAKISVEDKSINEADIEWSDSFEFNPSLEDQTITVVGNVKVPDSINNDDGSGGQLVDTKVTCDVHIEGAPYTKQATAFPSEGEHYGNIDVTLSTEEEGASIYYRFDEDSNWVLYTSPIQLTAQIDSIQNYTVYTIVKKDGMRSSQSQLNYEINNLSKHVESITLTPTKATLKPGNYGGEPGEAIQLMANVLPLDATNRSVTWFTDTEGLVGVDVNGLVRANNNGYEGEVIVYAQTIDGHLLAQCEITVGYTHAQSISIDKHDLSLNPGKVGEKGVQAQLTATVLPNEAIDKSVKWESSDTEIATVSDTGLVTANDNDKEGQIVIKVTTNDGGFVDTCQVSVNKPADPTPTDPTPSDEGPDNDLITYLTTATGEAFLPIMIVSIGLMLSLLGIAVFTLRRKKQNS